ncbi:hypothetical protein HK101_011687 [Irineochytrium annulatum]|nr:hypothetical protein HK101_011687 [Irineochytrium annulatum]
MMTAPPAHDDGLENVWATSPAPPPSVKLIDPSLSAAPSTSHSRISQPALQHLAPPSAALQHAAHHLHHYDHDHQTDGGAMMHNHVATEVSMGVSSTPSHPAPPASSSATVPAATGAGDVAHPSLGSVAVLLHRAVVAKTTTVRASVTAPPLSQGEERGAESAMTAHGRFIGPRHNIRFHSYQVYSRILQVAVCFWIVVGMVLIMTVYLAITINVSYASFNASRNLSVWPLLLGLAFYVELGWLFVGSLLRTALRLQMFVWGQDFGNDPTSDIFPIYLIEPYITNFINAIHVQLMKRRGEDPEGEGETDPLLGDRDTQPQAASSSSVVADAVTTLKEAERKEIIANRVDIVNHFIYMTFLLAVLGTPVLYVTLNYQFWAVLSFLSIGICVSSIFTIVALNLTARGIRTWRVLGELWSDPDDVTDAELRATYYATTGTDTGKDLLSVIVTRGIRGTAAVLVASLLFSGFNTDHSVTVVAAILLVILWALSLHSMRKLFSQWERSTFFQPHHDEISGEDYALYNGAEEWPAWVIFGFRTAFLVIGFSSLLYYDIKWRRREDASTDIVEHPLDVGIHRIFLYLLFVVAHDLALLIPLIRYRHDDNDWLFFFGHPRMRVLIIFALMGGIGASAVYSRIMYPGFASSVAVVLSVLLLSYRHPRCRWTNYQKNFEVRHWSTEARLEMRATRHAKGTLYVIFGVAIGAWFVSLLRGTDVDDSAPVSVLRSLSLVPKVSAIGGGLEPGWWKNATTVANMAEAASSDGIRIRPAVCSMVVSDGAGLGVLDIAAMARGSYEENEEDAQKKMQSYERPRLAKWRVHNSTIKLGGLGVRWIEFREDDEASPLSVVAVRGTSTLDDVFQDLYLWSTSALLQLSSFMGTMVALWPPEAVDQLAQVIMTFGPIDSTLVYWNKVEAHVDYLQKQNRTVIMTGHSLGGAVAAIVAGHKSISSASFSAPGLGYSVGRYGLSLKSLQKYTVNIVPWHDAVPCFDLQVGLIQSIPCRKEEFLSCHSLDLTIDTLTTQCMLRD